MKNILITICARGGSKSVPDKNIRLLNGKALIGYTIDIAFRLKEELANQYDIDVILSTDVARIKTAAATFGLVTDYERPAALATDEAGKIDAIREACLFSEKKHEKSYDYVMDMDVTAPLRTIEDLIEGLEMMEADELALTLFSVSAPHRNPYFNMVEKKSDGYVKLVKPLESTIVSRQVAPQVYDMNASFYIYRRSFFNYTYKTAITDKSIAYLMSHICFDIDYQLDFDIMEYLIKEQKLDFDFV